MTNDTLRDRLAPLDAAPASTLNAFEVQRRDALLGTLLSTDDRLPAPIPARREPRVRHLLVGGLAGAAALGLIAAALVAGPRLLPHGTDTPATAASDFSAVQLSSWTGTPAALNTTSSSGSAATAWCLSTTAQGPGTGPQTIQNADLRGQVASMIVLRGGNASLCMTAGADGGFWELVTAANDPAITVGSSDITVDSAGSHGDGSTGFSYVEGVAGSDVASVTVHNGTQSTVATLEKGRWTAWWPDSTPDGGLGGTVTITTQNGASRTVQAAGLTH